MTRNLKISLALVVVFVIGVAAALLIARADRDDAAATDKGAIAGVIRPDSHRLSNVPDGKVTFVEFLDFECEACGAFFPLVEQLRGTYGDRVSFVVRYFPLPSHYNSERAARAVEAAAQQGRFEQMYQKMYQTQAEWGEQRVPKDDVFRGYAVELGLDLARYDTDYNAQATVERVRADVADGRALGVQGTPTFFLNGKRLSPRSYDELTRAFDDALR
ncbi:thioredoxin domain-containing protein [Nocardia sp. NPDC051787]|uniref:DsbA family protein n=1 Tax=Nocardia sp. NPDC051787 TaxID=3155415 RepID=UPI00341A7421